MKRKKRIEKILTNNLNSQIIEIIDKSSNHQGHNNFTGKDETHFAIILQPKINKNFRERVLYTYHAN